MNPVLKQKHVNYWKMAFEMRITVYTIHNCIYIYIFITRDSIPFFYFTSHLLCEKPIEMNVFDRMCTIFTITCIDEWNKREFKQQLTSSRPNLTFVSLFLLYNNLSK